MLTFVEGKFNMKEILIGLLFAMLWASASTATKFGLRTGEPFVITNVRFVIAAALMLGWAHLVRRHPLPVKKDWVPLLVYGMLNCSIYLGAFSFAMRFCTAGIGTLSVGINPLIISVLSAFFLQKRIGLQVWAGLLLGIAGVGVATFPALQNSTATPFGVTLLAMSMLSYSIGTIYFSGRSWTLPRLVINGWQIFFGAVTLLPVTLLFTHWERQYFDTNFWATVWWLVVPVSVGAVQLWLYLLHKDPVKAALWLFLCPIMGFLYAWWLLNEPITVYTGIGTALVIIGLYLGQHSPQKKAPAG
jgi:probable blue pigment (indigoidine) exporter